MKPRLRLPRSPARGYKRQWYKCVKCGAVCFRDYIPFSLSNPILLLPCGHTPVGTRELGAHGIKPEEGIALFIEQYGRKVIEKNQEKQDG